MAHASTGTNPRAQRTFPPSAQRWDSTRGGLKKSCYRVIMRQRELDFAGITLFYKDRGLFSPAEIMDLRPLPSVVIFQ